MGGAKNTCFFFSIDLVGNSSLNGGLGVRMRKRRQTHSHAVQWDFLRGPLKNVFKAKLTVSILTPYSCCININVSVS